jgi:hypothetical protein
MSNKQISAGKQRVSKMTNVIWNVVRVFKLGEKQYVKATIAPCDFRKRAEYYTFEVSEFIESTDELL